MENHGKSWRIIDGGVYILSKFKIGVNAFRDV